MVTSLCCLYAVDHPDRDERAKLGLFRKISSIALVRVPIFDLQRYWLERAEEELEEQRA
jgi:hypothetical protein